jgi:hypothetical protein
MFNNVKIEHKEALIIGGIVIAILYFTLPRNKKAVIPKPETATPSDVATKENARIALDAYMDAVQAGEGTKNLNALNNELANTYGLKIYKNNGYYVAKNSEGKDILAAR